jgi:transcriptional regulator with XRE-family HTH domain
MQSVYVSKLFDVLKFLEIEQQEVCRQLGASKTQVSLWAHGKRRLPESKARPFIMFVWAAISAALSRAMDATRGPGESSKEVFDRADAMDPQEGQAMLEAWLRENVRQQAKLPLSRQLNEILYTWELEIAAVKGDLSQRIQANIRQLIPYEKQDPMTWSQQERRELQEASWALVRSFRYLEQLLDRPEEREWPRAPGPEMHPIEYLNQLAGWAGIPRDEPANRQADDGI